MAKCLFFIICPHCPRFTPAARDSPPAPRMPLSRDSPPLPQITSGTLVENFISIWKKDTAEKSGSIKKNKIYSLTRDKPLIYYAELKKHY